VGGPEGQEREQPENPLYGKHLAVSPPEAKPESPRLGPGSGANFFFFFFFCLTGVTPSFSFEGVIGESSFIINLIHSVG
jgi:hypothetical protein